jgi:hypothetical protein
MISKKNYLKYIRILVTKGNFSNLEAKKTINKLLNAKNVNSLNKKEYYAMNIISMYK